MSTFRNSLSLLVLLTALAGMTGAQTLTPAEIKNPAMRALQEKHFQQLQRVGDEIHAHVFPFAFYLSRVLDLELAQQERADQRSLRFDVYNGMTVVELTGNYFASYPGDATEKNHRVLRTFSDVILPILEIAVPALKDIPEVDGFALEISHQVRGKAMGMSREHPENLVMILNRDAAVRLVSARNDRDRQAAILEGQTFLNAEPFVFYLSDEAAQAVSDESKALTEPGKNPGGPAANPWGQAKRMSSSQHAVPRETSPAAAPRDTSKEALAAIQTSLQSTIEKIVKEVNPQANFVSYAPPAVVAFRKNAYLEFSIDSKLPPAATSSRYKLAALAFDDHIAHLIRPILAYFQGGDVEIDGIGFSTNIHPGTAANQPGGKPTVGEATEAVEFFLPLDSLRCYQNYDCTGQQLIEAGAVLINGERVSLDLQTAEADSR